MVVGFVLVGIFIFPIMYLTPDGFQIFLKVQFPGIHVLNMCAKSKGLLWGKDSVSGSSWSLSD